MPFTTYLYKLTLCARKSAEAQKAALKVVDCCLSEQGEMIKKVFSVQVWVVVV